MASDNTKLELKDDFNNREHELEAYKQADDDQLPGFVFLLPVVIEAYGICPFLNVFDNDSLHEDRQKWLHEQFDRGELYMRERNRMADGPASTVHLDKEYEQLKTTLTEWVANTINNDLELEPDLFQSFDELQEAFLKCKRGKTVNKQSKELKQKITRTMDAIMLSNDGFDFNRYMQTIYGMQLKYKPPTSTIPGFRGASTYFVELCTKCATNRTQRERIVAARHNAEQTAWTQLADLIAKEFKLPQSGRYFQKWSSLSEEKRNERILSYCEFYIREHRLPVHLDKPMFDAVLQRLEAKELRASDIKWETKRGVISDIVGMKYENGQFVVAKRPILKQKRSSTKKRREELFQTPEQKRVMQHAHRLLLYEVVSGQILNKEQIVHNVLYHLNIHGLATMDLIAYLNLRLDEMLERVRADAKLLDSGAD